MKYFIIKLTSILSIFFMILLTGNIPIHVKSYKENTRLISLSSSFTGGLFLSIGILYLIPQSQENLNQHYLRKIRIFKGGLYKIKKQKIIQQQKDEINEMYNQMPEHFQQTLQKNKHKLSQEQYTTSEMLQNKDEISLKMSISKQSNQIQNILQQNK
ncbi:hypothetical protein IMG5_082090 [Ichthyophthirius multifiliis]|uniref:Transmembrane protein n=1 Tax=Ichthyophthirius multifiliis TaxID=5932 RepID=G0QQP4_ICHMU|nr:hypothetical protein IMG5_082090 [Ichthyophthirius multifiliis]EGR32462.1 hypothetical protein IMG5_082090 [Ichthyophthirius multifiliis]|eukprot:XP_004036448.1 hypothetical protein IMG5_082090 [Ichthyophthirius multifiliis]